MATSSNATIQKLMDEIDELGPENLEAKLAEIARKVAEQQRKDKAAATGQQLEDIEIDDDPANAFACEGCQ